VDGDKLADGESEGELEVSVNVASPVVVNLTQVSEPVVPVESPPV
jgi:hypothetical protein